MKMQTLLLAGPPALMLAAAMFAGTQSAKAQEQEQEQQPEQAEVAMPPPPASGYLPCPPKSDADVTIAVVNNKIEVSPDQGEVTLPSSKIVHFKSDKYFQIKLELDSKELGSDPGQIPFFWSAANKDMCYRVGKGRYKLKYSVDMIMQGVQPLDPKIIVN